MTVAKSFVISWLKFFRAFLTTFDDSREKVQLAKWVQSVYLN